MEQRLKKEEEERNARRKRVEAIMSRTRKSQANAQKDEGDDGEKSKEDSPSDESNPVPSSKSEAQGLTRSLISETTQQLINSEQRAHSNSISLINTEPNYGLLLHHSNGTNQSNGVMSIENSMNSKSLFDNGNSTAQQQELNGHHNSMRHDNGLVTDTTIVALDHATVRPSLLIKS
ncbi:uncharacterized protein LOC106645313 [Copidosoma floridanum]|uniref:uncharacterized protein LOC106645313 n=1 Tax=Copidosoma floridanum TaxID=29053 RepID=UPI0006C966A4|nr:uncharacterized protein LOC106645313 [Copidosoma floridanum]